jgi:hypothetical protein
VTGHHASRVPPFGHPRINARLTAPRGLSRPPTSFIGSWYQGIHRAPLHTYQHHKASNISRHYKQKPRNRNPDTQPTTGPMPGIPTTRCSHPLSSSQTPHRTPIPTQATRPNPAHSGTSGITPGPDPDETTHATQTPVPSGPNSAPTTPTSHPTPRHTTQEHKQPTSERSRRFHPRATPRRTHAHDRCLKQPATHRQPERGAP